MPGKRTPKKHSPQIGGWKMVIFIPWDRIPKTSPKKQNFQVYKWRYTNRKKWPFLNGKSGILLIKWAAKRHLIFAKFRHFCCCLTGQQGTELRRLVRKRGWRWVGLGWVGLGWVGLGWVGWLVGWLVGWWIHKTIFFWQPSYFLFSKTLWWTEDSFVPNTKAMNA